MALTDLQVTVDDVLDEIPLNTAEVDATSEPVSTGDIENWIQDGSSQIANQLRRVGMSVDQLQDDSLRQLQDAVEAYAVAEALDAMGFLSERMRKYREKYEDLRERYVANPQSVTPNKSHFRSTIDADVDERGGPRTDFTDPDYGW